jgi:hypothetical protein
MIALRVYGDTSPSILKTAPLHKGLVLIVNGEEIIEEGLGFGVPVVKYPDHTYFAGSASVYADHNEKTIHIHFVMDTVNTNSLTHRPILTQLKQLANLLYQRSHYYRTLIAPVTRWRARTQLGINKFYRVPRRGEVHITYAIQQHSVIVTVDLSRLSSANWQTVTLLNEQGASIFTCYCDTSGLILNNEEIGVWDLVSARRAWLTSDTANFAFGVTTTQACTLRRGREQQTNYLSWAGFAYEMKSPRTHFHYTIQIQTKRP